MSPALLLAADRLPRYHMQMMLFETAILKNEIYRLFHDMIKAFQDRLGQKRLLKCADSLFYKLL